MIPSRLRPTCAALAAALLVLPRIAPAAERRADELERALAAIVDGSPLAHSRTGILAVAVDTGEVVYARDADLLLNPASNVKLVTSAAALARLGPGFRFATEFLVDPGARITPSVKTLYVRGKGDPTVVTERLWAIAGELEHLGLSRVGELVVDDGYFDAVRIGPGYDQETGDRAYLAPAGALSLDFNAVEIHVRPGPRRGARAVVELEPACDHLELVNRTVTVPGAGPRRIRVSSSSHAGRQRLVVEGRVPLGGRPQAMRCKVDEPAVFFGSALARLLEVRGVKVGKVRPGVVPSGARLVHVAESDTLGEIVRRLNKTSNNFTAEQLLKTIGAEATGAPGTWASGVAAVEAFLADVGIPRGTYVMKNGSGLNDTNRFSARQLVTLLRAMWARFPLAAEYVASLPVAGRDGTIRWRMEGTEAAGRLRAKTGTLESVTSLSGYVEDGAHRALAFAVLVNDVPARRPVVRAVDALGSALAASGGPAAGIAAAVASGKEPSGPTIVPAAAPQDLARQARTYYAMGRAADPRNETFLRSALRAETDPALRLAIAESVYLSEPDGETARRTFLEALSPEPQVLGRLWQAVGSDDPPPVLGSLGDLAGEGMPEALARLVELAPASAQDGRLAAGIAETLSGVAASAPEELVDALRQAPPTLADAAVGALGAGLARADADHPFPAALRALAAKTGEEGAFARVLGPRLEQAEKAGDAARSAPSLVPAAAGTGLVPAKIH